MNVSFGWKYSHLCPVCLNQTLVLLSMSNSSIQPKRYLGGRFCEHAIQQEIELIMKSRLLHEIYYAGIFWIQVLWPFYILLIIDGQDRHFNGVTNDIRNHERLENLQKKKKKGILNFLNILFLNCRKSRKRKCKKKSSKKKNGLSWVVLNDQIIELKVTLIKESISKLSGRNTSDRNELTR